MCDCQQPAKERRRDGRIEGINEEWYSTRLSAVSKNATKVNWSVRQQFKMLKE